MFTGALCQVFGHSGLGNGLASFASEDAFGACSFIDAMRSPVPDRNLLFQPFFTSSRAETRRSAMSGVEFRGTCSLTIR